MKEFRLKGLFAPLALIFLLGGCGETTTEPPADAVVDILVEEEPAGHVTTVDYLGLPSGKDCCLIIAHAGGGINGSAYTNSLEALTRNHELGIRLFEIDLQMTSDGFWAATHDWPRWKRMSSFEGDIPPSLETFEQTPIHQKRISWGIEADYSPVSLAGIEEFLREHPEASIVTDVKELELFENLVERVLASPYKSQFIFQAYRTEHIGMIKALDPSARIILTLYRLGRPPGLYQEISDNRENLFGITLPMNWAFDEATRTSLLATQVPIFLHGAPANINSMALHQDFADKGISGFYLD